MARKYRTPEEQIDRLRIYNVLAGLLHLGQAVAFGYALTLLGEQVTFAVTGDFLAGPPGFPIDPERVELFRVNVGMGVVVFLGLSAFFHFVISMPGFFRRYRNGLTANHNYFRWVEYSLSASVMIWLIAQINGITDVGALVAIFAVNAAMIMFGAVQEKYEEPGGGLLPFWLGCLVGIVPWAIVAVYFFSPGSTSGAEPPSFVIGILISLFVFFNTFALNQWLQYRQIGRWRDYLVGERTYITLSLIAKSALAWQVFSGAILPAMT